MRQAACNNNASPRQSVAATSPGNPSFDEVFGASGQVLTDAGGNLNVNVPARSAVVYVGQL